jgi:hypothetical protein
VSTFFDPISHAGEREDRFEFASRIIQISQQRLQQIYSIIPHMKGFADYFAQALIL